MSVNFCSRLVLSTLILVFGMTSGVRVNEAVKAIFNEVKLRHTQKLVVLKFSDDLKEIVIDEGEKEQQQRAGNGDVFKMMQDKMGETRLEGRYFIYDHDYMDNDMEKTKLFFITWCDDSKTKLKNKMLLASTKQAVIKELGGGILEHSCNDLGDLERNTLDQRAKDNK